MVKSNIKMNPGKLTEFIRILVPEAEEETVKIDGLEDDGKCILYASGRDENGNATVRQELCKADSVKAMFEIFYNNNWLDSSGNVKAVG